MQRKIFSIAGAIFGFILLAATVEAAPASFYQGQVLRIVVGLSAGGGYDTWARAIGRHLGKHIPGNPTVVVENMPGAGAMVATNYLYRMAEPDGLTIGHITGSLILNQILERPGAKFEARKFEYIGSPCLDDQVLFISKASGITSMDKWINSKRPVKLGGEAPGTTFSDNVPRILRAALGLPIQPISGYKGTAEVKLAIGSGELDGDCLSWESGKVTWAKQMEKGDIIPVLQCGPKPLAEIPNVPLAISFAKTDDARMLIEVAIHKASLYGRPFLAPPGTPKDRIQIIRNAFEATFNDKQFLAELQQAKMNLKPITGEALANAVQELFNLDPAMKAKLKDILYK